MGSQDPCNAIKVDVFLLPYRQFPEKGLPLDFAGDDYTQQFSVNFSFKALGVEQLILANLGNRSTP
jgi:hypothetical protein